MRVGKRLGLGFGDASGFSEYFGLPALAVALDNAIIADNAPVGTVVGTFNVAGVTIVGASPFVIVGFELLTGPDYIEPGTVTFDVSAPGYGTTTITVIVLDNDAVLWNGEHTTWNGEQTTWNAAP